MEIIKRMKLMELKVEAFNLLFIQKFYNELLPLVQGGKMITKIELEKLGKEWGLI